MTNIERWNLYTKDLPTPQPWIDIGWIFVVCSALQRRVWYGDAGRELFPNLYVGFVSRPGVGKSVLLSEITRLLKHHKDPFKPKLKVGGALEDQPIISCGPDTTTFEELMADVSRNITTHKRINAAGRPEIYTHMSYCLPLDELSSMFRRDHSQVVKALIRLYDSGDYDYTTKTQSCERIRRSCLSMISGTQPSFLIEANANKILTDGIISRIIWMFAEEPRFYTLEQSRISEEQRQCWNELAAWVLQLTKVMGPIDFTPEAWGLMSDWYHNTHVPAEKTAPPAMQEYLVRKKVAVMKLAAGFHFSDSLDMKVSLGALQKALNLLNENEKTLKAGMTIIGRNPLNPLAIQVLRHITSVGQIDLQGLLTDFSADISLPELNEILDVLLLQGKISVSANKYTASK